VRDDSSAELGDINDNPLQCDDNSSKALDVIQYEENLEQASTSEPICNPVSAQAQGEIAIVGKTHKKKKAKKSLGLD
jgi:hypothetical protein